MENLPERTKEDYIHALAKGVTSAIPYIGGPLSVLLETVFSSPIEKRREKWFKELADSVSRLENAIVDFTPEKLSQNDIFITVSMQATQIAIRNHHEEKLYALKNAVFHSGMPNDIDEQLQLMFLRFVDDLTPLHLIILVLLDNPLSWMQKHQVHYPEWSMGAINTVINHCIPNLQKNREILDQIIRDLQSHGLIQQGNFYITTTGDSMVASHTTDFGKLFISYISED